MNNANSFLKYTLCLLTAVTILGVAGVPGSSNKAYANVLSLKPKATCTKRCSGNSCTIRRPDGTVYGNCNTAFGPAQCDNMLQNCRNQYGMAALPTLSLAEQE